MICEMSNVKNLAMSNVKNVFEIFQMSQMSENLNKCFRIILENYDFLTNSKFLTRVLDWQQ
jgi:hypothetical protein